jgi:H+-transporting ATPase
MSSVYNPNRDVENNAAGRRLSSISYKEDAKIDEYTRLVRWMSTYRDTKRDHVDEGEIRESRVWFAPWRKRKFLWKYIGVGQEFPDDWKFTDINHGLSDSEVEERRKVTGYNELTAEKVNQFRKILGYFQGPILYGEELSHPCLSNANSDTLTGPRQSWRSRLCSPPVWPNGLTLVLSLAFSV